MERYKGDNETIIGYCAYCKNPVRVCEGHVFEKNKIYHYDRYNKLKNCYFPEEME